MPTNQTKLSREEAKVEKFKEFFRKHSKNKHASWKEIKQEWSFVGIFIEENGTCNFCSHHPITNHCIFQNIKNGNRIVVGNVCVRYFDAEINSETNSLFRVFKKMLKNPESNFVNKQFLQIMLNSNEIDEENVVLYQQCIKDKNKREKFKKFILEINLKIMNYMNMKDKAATSNKMEVDLCKNSFYMNGQNESLKSESLCDISKNRYQDQKDIFKKNDTEVILRIDPKSISGLKHFTEGKTNVFNKVEVDLNKSCPSTNRMNKSKDALSLKLKLIHDVSKNRGQDDQFIDEQFLTMALKENAINDIEFAIYLHFLKGTSKNDNTRAIPEIETKLVNYKKKKLLAKEHENKNQKDYGYYEGKLAQVTKKLKQS